MAPKLGEWLEAISCAALLDALDDYGVETTEDLLLLDPPDITTLAGSLKKVQAKKFETALEALRSGSGYGPARTGRMAPERYAPFTSNSGPPPPPGGGTAPFPVRAAIAQPQSAPARTLPVRKTGKARKKRPATAPELDELEVP